MKIYRGLLKGPGVCLLSCITRFENSDDAAAAAAASVYIIVVLRRHRGPEVALGPPSALRARRANARFIIQQAGDLPLRVLFREHN